MSLKQMVDCGLPSLRLLAKCAGEKNKSLREINEFAARKSFNECEFYTLSKTCVVERLSSLCQVVVLRGERILDLKTLAKTALMVSSASRAVGEFLHLGSTKPEGVLCCARAFKLEVVQDEQSLAMSPSRKRKASTDVVSRKHARLDQITLELSNCSISEQAKQVRSVAAHTCDVTSVLENKLKDCSLADNPLQCSVSTPKEPMTADDSTLESQSKPPVQLTTADNSQEPSQRQVLSLPNHNSPNTSKQTGPSDANLCDDTPRAGAVDTSDTSLSSMSSSSTSSDSSSHAISPQKNLSLWYLRNKKKSFDASKPGAKKKLNTNLKNKQNTRLDRSKFQKISTSKQSLISNYMSSAETNGNLDMF